MTYEEKYKKYKQKYLNLLTKINVLKGGVGEYQEGVRLINRGDVVEAVGMFEKAVILNRDISAMNYLIDIYYFGRIGVPINLPRYREIKELLRAAERVLPPRDPRSIPGIDLMERCFEHPHFVFPRNVVGGPPASQQLTLLQGAVEAEYRANRRDQRLLFLRYYLDDRNVSKKNDATLHPNDNYELSLCLRAKREQQYSEIPKMRGIIEGAFLYSKWCLDRLDRPNRTSFFTEARDLCYRIISCASQGHYDDSTNSYLERAAVLLTRMGERLPSNQLFSRDFTQSNLGLRPTDAFVFDLSNIDHNIKIVADLIGNLRSIIRPSGRVPGFVVGSSQAFPSAAIEHLMLFPYPAGGGGGENPLVDAHVALALSTQVSLSINTPQPVGIRPRVFLFCGDGNDRLSTLDTPNTPGRNPLSILATFSQAVRAHQNVEFVIVSYQYSLSGNYRALQRSSRNLRILSLLEFIKGNLPRFTPLANISTDALFRGCMNDVLPYGWTYNQAPNRYTAPTDVGIDPIVISDAELDNEVPPIPIAPLSDRLLQCYQGRISGFLPIPDDALPLPLGWLRYRDRNGTPYYTNGQRSQYTHPYRRSAAQIGAMDGYARAAFVTQRAGIAPPPPPDAVTQLAGIEKTRCIGALAMIIFNIMNSTRESLHSLLAGSDYFRSMPAIRDRIIDTILSIRAELESAIAQGAAPPPPGHAPPPPPPGHAAVAPPSGHAAASPPGQAAHPTPPSHNQATPSHAPSESKRYASDPAANTPDSKRSAAAAAPPHGHAAAAAPPHGHAAAPAAAHAVAAAQGNTRPTINGEWRMVELKGTWHLGHFNHNQSSSRDMYRVFFPDGDKDRAVGQNHQRVLTEQEQRMYQSIMDQNR